MSRTNLPKKGTFARYGNKVEKVEGILILTKENEKEGRNFDAG